MPCTVIAFSTTVTPSQPRSMSRRRESEGYGGRGLAGYDDYRSSSSRSRDYEGGPYLYESYREKDAEPGGYRSSHVFRDQEYSSMPAREYSGQFNRVARVDRTTGHRGSSGDTYQAPGSSYKQFTNKNRDEAESYCQYGGSPATSSHYISPRETDIPSLAESETSSLGNSWDEDDWNRKKSNDKPLYTSSRYTTSPEAEESWYAQQSKQSSAAVTRLPFKQQAAYRETEVSKKTIEVSPGEFSRLRGADETWRAIKCDFYMPCECMCCRLTIFCIQDAQFVLCPDCRVVSPMDGKVFEGTDGGVGLGFKMEDLARYQDDIEEERKVAQKM